MSKCVGMAGHTFFRETRLSNRNNSLHYICSITMDTLGMDVWASVDKSKECRTATLMILTVLGLKTTMGKSISVWELDHQF